MVGPRELGRPSAPTTTWRSRERTVPSAESTQRIFEIVTNAWISRAVYAGTALGLPAHLADGPRTTAELAELTSSDPRALGRLLRALTGVGLFRTDERGRHVLTDVGQALRSDVPGSLASLVQMELGEAHHDTWGQILHSVQTGEAAFAKAVGCDIWAFFEGDPVMNAHLGQAMSGLTAMVADTVIEAYDFGPYEKIVDVGGGEGAFLSAVLAAHPRARGVVFDLPHVVPAGLRTSLTRGSPSGASSSVAASSRRSPRAGTSTR